MIKIHATLQNGSLSNQDIKATIGDYIFPIVSAEITKTLDPRNPDRERLVILAIPFDRLEIKNSADGTYEMDIYDRSHRYSWT